MSAFLSLAYFAWHNIFGSSHVARDRTPCFFLLDGVLLHTCIHFLHPFTYWWTFSLLPYPNCPESHSNKYGHFNVCSTCQLYFFGVILLAYILVYQVIAMLFSVRVEIVCIPTTTVSELPFLFIVSHATVLQFVTKQLWNNRGSCCVEQSLPRPSVFLPHNDVYYLLPFLITTTHAVMFLFQSLPCVSMPTVGLFCPWA